MRKLISICILTTLLCGCNDFTDTVPKGKVIPETTDDFKGIIIDVQASSVIYPLINLSSDDAFTNKLIGNNPNTKAYYWMEDFYTETQNDQTWNKCYQNIYYANVVIDNVMGSKEGSESEKASIMAEAKCWRAYLLWNLYCIYAPAFDNTTADTDLAIPMPLIPDLEAKLSRATSRQVINQILADLDGAEQLLPEESANGYRPSRYAVHALRARIYHYIGQFDKAATEAAEALKGNSKLNDMRTWSFKDENAPASGIINRQSDYRLSDETIWYQAPADKTLQQTLQMSEGLKNMYQSNDLRFKFWYSTITRFKDGNYYFLWPADYSLTVPEMILIQAEAKARKNDNSALNLLENIRKMRFTEADYLPLTIPQGQSLLSVVLAERRRELALTGLRWFDMKRLAKEGIYSETLIRELNGETYQLSPKSSKYAFPIPLNVMSVNPNISPNNRKE